MDRRDNQILEENTQRTKGIDALNSNIEAAKALAQIVKTTLGPMGMDKMLIDNLGNTIITNDGVKILKEMEIDHPGAKILVEVAKTQESEVGDGTTSAVILTGELLSKAQVLLSQKIHPTIIIRGYKKASEESLIILEKNCVKIDLNDEKTLRAICETAMTGKVAESSKEKLSKIIHDAVMCVKEDYGIAKNSIKILKIVGGNTNESSMVRGIVLDKNLANPNMPVKINNAKVLLVNFPLEVRELDSDAKLQINTPQDYEMFLRQEQDYLRNIAFKIKQIGAQIVICQKGIDDNVAYYLAKEGIMAIRRTRKSDIEKLSKALGKPIVSSIDDLDEKTLAVAGNVEQKEVLGENYIFIEELANPKAITLLLKSSTIHVLDEIERAAEDSIGDLNALIKSKRIVAGAGAIELELYKDLINYSKTFAGKEQIVIKAFAESFLSIPKVLCENCGFDEIETLAQLISNHEKGLSKSGVDGFEGVVDDTLKKGIIEPINVKEQAIKSATEITSMILRIDDIIAAKTLRNDKRDIGSDF